MKKYFKKISSLLAAMVMVLSMCVSVSADETAMTAVKPEASLKTTVSVSGVEVNGTIEVNAYQIVKGSYNEYGFVEFVKADENLNIANVNAPTSEEVLAIAAAINNNSISLESKQMTADNGIYSAEVNAGYWVVIVTGSGSKIYNPMLVSAYYSIEGSGSSSELIGTSVSVEDNWSLTGQNVYAKSSEITVDKEIVNPGSGNSSGDDVAIGDTVTFKITTQIPEYTSQYNFTTEKDITFTIKDTLVKGLKGIKNVKVVVGEDDVTSDTSTVTISAHDENSNGFTVDFESDDYLITNAGKEVVITYDSVLTEAAGVNFNANPNKAELEYTNNPGSTSKTQDITYHYTFEINGEIVKVGEDDKALENAEFTLFKAAVEDKETDGSTVKKWSYNAKTDVLKTAVSGPDGKLIFTGLDAGYYILKETKAPTGYSLSDKETKIEIQASYKSDGTLEEYKIIVDESVTSDYTVEASNLTVTNLPNTKLVSLPSTGGMGTYVFTIAGVALMVLAVAILFIKRRNKA